MARYIPLKYSFDITELVKEEGKNTVKEAFPEWNEDEDGTLSSSMQVSETDYEIIIEFNLPGITKENLDITVKKQTIDLVITKENNNSDACSIRIRKVLNLPKYTVPMATRAKYEDGVLKLIVPKKAAFPEVKIRVE